MLDALQIDGLVHVTSLNSDYYHFDSTSQSLVGERSGARFSLGDPIDIVVSKVDMDTRKIDFQLAGGKDKIAKTGTKKEPVSKKRGKNRRRR